MPKRMATLLRAGTSATRGNVPPLPCKHLFVCFFLWALHVTSENNKKRAIPTNNALRCLISDAEFFAIKHRLSIQIGAKSAKMCVQSVHVLSDWASILHTTIGGWVVFISCSHPSFVHLLFQRQMQKKSSVRHIEQHCCISGKKSIFFK